VWGSGPGTDPGHEKRNSFGRTGAQTRDEQYLQGSVRKKRKWKMSWEGDSSKKEGLGRGKNGEKKRSDRRNLGADSRGRRGTKEEKAWQGNAEKTFKAMEQGRPHKEKTTSHEGSSNSGLSDAPAWRKSVCDEGNIDAGKMRRVRIVVALALDEKQLNKNINEVSENEFSQEPIAEQLKVGENT